MAHLLIVDDEQSICWGMNKLAVELGHTASLASSAEQAFVLAEQKKPDAIVLDVRLPGMDGLTAMGRLREQVGDVRESAESQLERFPGANDLHERLARLVEPPLLRAALARHDGQYAAAARHLGLHRVTLKRKVEGFGGVAD